MKVLTKLKAVMKEKDVSQAELAASITMHARSIENASKRGVSLGTCKRIAKGLNVKLEVLL